MDRRLTIGVLARRAGVTTKAVRYYEKIGLLRPAERGDNHYRYYNKNHINQLRFIRRTQQLGLTLAEIGDLMNLARDVKCNELRSALDELFSHKIREYELKIAALKTFKRSLHSEDDVCACQAFVPDCDCLPSPKQI